MLLTPPSASNGYHVTAQHELSDELLNAIFGDVHVRLVDLEAVKLDAQLAIDQVLALSAETVVATLAEEIANGRAGLAEVRGEFQVLRDEYEAIQAGGLFASRIQITLIEGVAGNTVQAALASIAGKAKEAADAVSNLRVVKHLAYEDRGQLRAINGPAESNALVRGLGFFVWVGGSTEPDDDETCFATTNGRWELEAVSLDHAAAILMPAIEAASGGGGGAALNYSVTRHSIVNTVASLSGITSASFVVDIAEAAVGDGVIVMPRAPMRISNSDVMVSGYVSAVGKVTVSLQYINPNFNASLPSEAYGAANPWSLLLVKAA